MNVCRIFSIAVGIFVAGQLAAQSPAPATLVRAGRLLDPRSGNVLSPAAVLIENDKIKEVGPPPQVQTHVSGDVKTIDLGNATLLPGLIDSHTHLLIDPIAPAEVERARHYNGGFAPALLLAIVESPSKRVLIGAQLFDVESQTVLTQRAVPFSGLDFEEDGLPGAARNSFDGDVLAGRWPPESDGWEPPGQMHAHPVFQCLLRH